MIVCIDEQVTGATFACWNQSHISEGLSCWEGAREEAAFFLDGDVSLEQGGLAGRSPRRLASDDHARAAFGPERGLCIS